MIRVRQDDSFSSISVLCRDLGTDLRWYGGYDPLLSDCHVPASRLLLPGIFGAFLELEACRQLKALAT